MTVFCFTDIMKGMFGMSVSLLLLCVLWGDSQPVHDAAHTVREVKTLLVSCSHKNEKLLTQLFLFIEY